MKRLIRKAEIYDGFNYKDIYYEVYKNPTASEIQAVKKADTYSSIRGVIDQNGDKYIWIGEMGHYSINRYISNQIPTNYFRFAYSNYWIIDLKRMGANINSNECKKIIKDNLDFLSQIGNINSPVDIMGLTDRNYLEFNSINDFLSNRKVIAIEQKLNIGDQVQWKRHPYDTSTYEVMEVLPNGNVFIDNGINAFTDIKQSVLKFIKRSAE